MGDGRRWAPFVRLICFSLTKLLLRVMDFVSDSFFPFSYLFFYLNSRPSTYPPFLLALLHRAGDAEAVREVVWLRPVNSSNRVIERSAHLV